MAGPISQPVSAGEAPINTPVSVSVERTTFHSVAAGPNRRCPGMATWGGLRRVAGAGGNDIEDFGGVGSADAEVGLLGDHLCQGLVDGRPLLWWLLLGG